MKKYTIPAFVLLALVPVASPAAAQNKEHVQMAAELRMLQEQNQQLSLALQQTMEVLKAVNGRIDAAMEAMRKGFADQALATKNVAGDVSTIAERARDNESRLRTMSDEIGALQATITSLATTIAQTGAAAAPVDPNAPPVASTPGAAVSPVTPAPSIPLPNTLGLSPARMLQQAKGDYDRGDYSLAITGFEQLIKTFPDTEAATEAQYWIGESQLYLNRFPEAIAAFNQALARGRFAYAPDALYKRGQAQERQQDVAAARASYEQVIAQFPQSAAATLAQQRLNRLAPAAGTPPARP